MTHPSAAVVHCGRPMVRMRSTVRPDGGHQVTEAAYRCGPCGAGATITIREAIRWP